MYIECLFCDNLLLFFVLAVVLIGCTLTIIMSLLRKRDDRGDMAIAEVFKEAVKDPPSLIALILTLLVVSMVVVNESIPQLIEQAFFLAIGYYFGERKKSSSSKEAES